MSLIIYWPKMATNCVRQCTLCRTEVVINTTGNHISAEHDILLSQNYYFTPKPVPLQFHDLISIQKALGLFPCTQKQNKLEWILFWRKRLPPSSEHLLKTQRAIYSETLLPRSHVILTYTLCLFTTVKNWSKKQWMVHGGITELQIPHYVLNQHSMMYVAALAALPSYSIYYLVKWNNKVKGYNKTKSCKPL